jgi:hypothetical protein
MLSTNGGGFPRWSADGKRLFYGALNGDVMAVDVQADASFQNGVPRRLFNAAGVGFSVNPSQRSLSRAATVHQFWPATAVHDGVELDVEA